MLEERNPAGSLLDVLLAGAAMIDRPTPPVGLDAPASYRPAAVPAFLSVGDTDRVRLDPEPAVPAGAVRIEADSTPAAEPVARFVEFEAADLIPAWVAMPTADAMAERPPAGDDGPLVEPPQAGGGAVTPAAPLATPDAPVAFPPVTAGRSAKGDSGGGATPSFGPGDYNWVDIVQSAKVREVTFSGPDLITIAADPGTEAYPDPPHWVDPNLDGYIDWDAGEHALPVGYPRDTNPVVSARFTPTYGKMPYLPADYDLVVRAVTQLQATQPEYFGIPWMHVSVEGNDLVLPPTVVPNPFPDYVNYGTLKLDWQFSRNGGGSWYPAGITENELYVTLATPTISPVYHTPIHLSVPISASVPAADEATVIAKAWENYSGKQVNTQHLKPDQPGVPLTYYANWKTDVITAEGLLDKKDGQCGAFIRLFRRSLKEAGVTTTEMTAIEIKPISRFEGLAVKSWELIGIGDANSVFSHRNLAKDTTMRPEGENLFQKVDGKWKYVWGPGEEAFDKAGVRGQNSDDPQSLFAVHYIIKVGDKYYDPSYGTGPFVDAAAWEKDSLFGYTVIDRDNGKYRMRFRPDIAADKEIRDVPVLWEGP